MRRIIALVAVMALLNLAAAGCRHVAGSCDCEHAGPQNHVATALCNRRRRRQPRRPGHRPGPVCPEVIEPFWIATNAAGTLRLDQMNL